MDPDLSAFLEIFILLKYRERTYLHSRLKRITTLPLAQRPLLIPFLYIPDPQVRLLWGIYYVVTSYKKITPEYSKFLAFP